MRTSRLSKEQIVGVLREHDAGASVVEFSRRHGVSEQTIYRWKPKYSGLERSELRRLKALEAENTRALPPLPATALRARFALSWWARSNAGRCHVSIMPS
jgi:putative transposase